MNGLLICLEGGNGAGKSKVIAGLSSYLIEKGRSVTLTREPGGTAIGDLIREILLGKDSPKMCVLTELLLFVAARAENYQEVIVPALNKNHVVIADRFDSSSVAFQHFGKGLPRSQVDAANKLVLGDFVPHLTVILDIDPEIGMQRILDSGEKLDRIETEAMGLHERARQGYLSQARENPERFVVIDAAQRPEQVLQQIIDVVAQKMAEAGQAAA